MTEIKANYGTDHVREWMEMRPPQRKGHTREGFPWYCEAILLQSDSRVPIHAGLVGNVILPANQDGMTEGEVRVIFSNYSHFASDKNPDDGCTE